MLRTSGLRYLAPGEVSPQEISAEANLVCEWIKAGFTRILKKRRLPILNKWGREMTLLKRGGDYSRIRS